MNTNTQTTGEHGMNGTFYVTCTLVGGFNHHGTCWVIRDETGSVTNWMEKRHSKTASDAIQIACDGRWVRIQGIHGCKTMALGQIQKEDPAPDPDQPTEPDPGEGWRRIDIVKEDPQEGDEYWSDANRGWRPRFRVHARFKTNQAYRRRITPEPQWHDDAAPTVEQVGNEELCLSTDASGDVEVWPGGAVRNSWRDGTDCASIAWMKAPSPYTPAYQPPTTWQDPSTEPPKKGDADHNGEVAASMRGMPLVVEQWHVVRDCSGAYSAWIPTAALLSACRGKE